MPGSLLVGTIQLGGSRSPHRIICFTTKSSTPGGETLHHPIVGGAAGEDVCYNQYFTKFDQNDLKAP
jgi:hypothetical protein